MASGELVVVGAGAAGLYTALLAARVGARVTLVSATELAETSSYWAQGGLAAALAADDSVELHLEDTLNAGRGAVDLSAARVLVDEAPGPSRICRGWASRLTGTQTAGWRWPRRWPQPPPIVHAGGAATGRRIVRQLSAWSPTDERIEVLEGRRVTALLTATGAAQASCSTTASCCTRGDGVQHRRRRAAWARTTNPSGAVGAGLLLAYAGRGGAGRHRNDAIPPNGGRVERMPPATGCS